MSITIKDVAKKAGVSIATVSHVLNKTRYVSDELIENVNNAVDELGYYPNLLVGSLRNKKTYTIGLIMPSISNETFGRLAENIQQKLFKHNYNIIICNTLYDADVEQAELRTLLTKKVDGIIIIPTSTNKKIFEKIINTKVPLIFVDRIIRNLKVDTVIVDNFKGTYEAIKYLIDLGHKKIGYIDRMTDHSHSVDQKKGYKNALEDSGIDFKPELVVRANGFDYGSGADAAKKLLNKVIRPTAIFAYFDIIALGAMRKVLDMGLKVPNDVSIIGCDGMPFTQSCNPRLTTIKFPIFKISKIACDIILKRIKNPDFSKEQEVVVRPRLIKRESAGPVSDPE